MYADGKEECAAPFCRRWQNANCKKQSARCYQHRTQRRACYQHAPQYNLFPSRKELMTFLLYQLQSKIERSCIFMSKKSNGEVSISFETARNRWRAAITDPHANRIVKRFKTKKEAQEWLAITQSEIYRNVYVPASNITVGEWLIEYLHTYCAPNVRPKTFLRYTQVAAYMLPIANIPLQQLTIPDVQRFYNTITLSASSKIKIHTLLKAAVTKACQVEILSKNIMLNIDRPKADQQEVQIFTQGEIHIILRAIKESRYYAKYYPLFAFAIATGARLGEILGLKLNCVHSNYVEIKKPGNIVPKLLLQWQGY